MSMEQIGKTAERAIRQASESSRVRGRQDRSGQEKVIDMSKLTERLPHLVKLHSDARDANSDLSKAVKAVAEKSGLLASVVRRVVVAKAGESFDEKKKEAEQLELVFAELAK